MEEVEKELTTVESEQTTPQNYFVEETTQSEPPAEISDATAMVDKVLAAGIVHKVQSDETVKEKILKTADTVIDTQLSVATSKANTEEKKAYFEEHEAACSYFGYDEKTTSKSHVRMMRVWAWVFNTLYIITLGFFVVAPITFTAHKLKVAIKQTWIVFLLALLIYVAVVGTPILIAFLGGK